MSDDYMRQLEIQRKNFEAQFGSLETLGFEDKSRVRDEASDEEASDEGDELCGSDEFEGLSGDSGDESDSDGSEDEDEDDDTEEQAAAPLAKPVKVIKLTDKYTSMPRAALSRADKKLLQSGRAATLAEMSKKQNELNKLSEKQKKQGAKEDGDNLENDLKLQRLLQESHILADQQQYSGADLTLQTLDYEEPTGKARQRTLDSRIRSIASVNSATGGLPKKLEKMPMSMRKGMVSKYEKRVAKYEEEAKNAGIVLSKIKKGERRNIQSGKGATSITDRIGSGKKSDIRIRDRGLKISSVGRSTRNGLVISKDDIERINNAGKRRTGGKKGGRR